MVYGCPLAMWFSSDACSPEPGSFQVWVAVDAEDCPQGIPVWQNQEVVGHVRWRQPVIASFRTSWLRDFLGGGQIPFTGGTEGLIAAMKVVLLGEPFKFGAAPSNEIGSASIG